MNIIIDFVLKNIKTNTQRIFWSCQLPSKVESFDKNFMNNENSYKLKRYADFQIVANYEECSEGLFKQHTENKNERPPVFLACNKIKNIPSCRLFAGPEEIPGLSGFLRAFFEKPFHLSYTRGRQKVTIFRKKDSAIPAEIGRAHV